MLNLRGINAGYLLGIVGQVKGFLPFTVVMSDEMPDDLEINNSLVSFDNQLHAIDSPFPIITRIISAVH